MNFALTAFQALSQPMRLDALRRLIAAQGDGLSACEIAAALDVRTNTLSTNLGILSQAGLVTGTRDGRFIQYRAKLDTIRALISFLLNDCCGGRPGICAPILESAATEARDAS